MQQQCGEGSGGAVKQENSAVKMQNSVRCRSNGDGAVEMQWHSVLFHLDGSINFSNVESGNMCSAVQQGHFSIAVKSIAPSPAPASDLRELQSRRFDCRLRQPRRVL
ncbi:hypothetical protein ACFX19_039059 [Malus domestica]